MISVGDIVEHDYGRWKGRRLWITGIDQFGRVETQDAKGNISCFLDTGRLRVVHSSRLPLVHRWLTVWHRSPSPQRNVLRNAFRARRLHKQCNNLALREKMEWFLSEYLKYSDAA